MAYRQVDRSEGGFLTRPCWSKTDSEDQRRLMIFDQHTLVGPDSLWEKVDLITHKKYV
jgi:hypothetical protein